MRNPKLLLLALATLLIASCTPPDPDAYYGKITGFEADLASATGALGNSFKGNSEEITTAYVALGAEVDTILVQLRAMEPYEESTELRDAAIAYFDFYRLLVDGEYRQIVNTLKQPEITPEDFTQMEALMGKIPVRLAEFQAILDAAKQKFAAKHSIVVTSGS